MCLNMAMKTGNSPPGQNGHYFPDNIFKYIFMNAKILYFDSNFTEVCSQGSN